jgi:hypothetical protein
VSQHGRHSRYERHIRCSTRGHSLAFEVRDRALELLADEGLVRACELGNFRLSIHYFATLSRIIFIDSWCHRWNARAPARVIESETKRAPGDGGPTRGLQAARKDPAEGLEFSVLSIGLLAESNASEAVKKLMEGRSLTVAVL